MSDFKKWFSARARNPDKITLEEAFEAGAQSQRILIVPARITPGKAPESVHDYCYEAAEGYSDGWNDCIKEMKPVKPTSSVSAAAPELLAFVKEWLSRQGTDENYMVVKARAAIAKATGAKS